MKKILLLLMCISLVATIASNVAAEDNEESQGTITENAKRVEQIRKRLGEIQEEVIANNSELSSMREKSKQLAEEYKNTTDEKAKKELMTQINSLTSKFKEKLVPLLKKNHEYMELIGKLKVLQSESQ